MSLIDPDDWYTGEYDQQVPVRPKARPAVACPASTAQAIDVVTNRYASRSNDDPGDL
jgi:hypothetical protein